MRKTTWGSHQNWKWNADSDSFIKLKSAWTEEREVLTRKYPFQPEEYIEDRNLHQQQSSCRILGNRMQSPWLLIRWWRRRTERIAQFVWRSCRRKWGLSRSTSKKEAKAGGFPFVRHCSNITLLSYSKKEIRESCWKEISPRIGRRHWGINWRFGGESFWNQNFWRSSKVIRYICS